GQYCLTHGQTLFLSLVCKFNDQNAVLGDQSDQHNDPYLTKDIDGLVRDPQADHGPSQRHGHGQQNDEGIDQTFKLSSQHQVDQKDSENESKDETGTALGIVAALARK